MPIQWFPGHMNAARKRAAEAMAEVDVVVEVVDARLPEASANPMVRELRMHRQRPCLRVLNKADLADPDVTAQWLAYYNAHENIQAVALSCRTPAEAAKVPRLCQALAPHRNDNIKPLRMMIMGIPNVGKSTLMNALIKRRVAAVGDEPAVTKSLQRYDIGPRLTLFDTPGLLWPKIEYDSDGYMLAASHAVGVNAVIEEEVAAFLGDLLLTRYPRLVAQRYRVEIETLDGVGLVQAVAERRGCRIKGGGLDLEKAALILLNDYRSGALGRISLETPASRAAMIEAHKTRKAGPQPEDESAADED